MIEERIGYRYAKSVFALAKEKNSLETMHDDMAMITEVVDENRDLKLMIESPIVNGSKKQEVLDQVFASHYKSELAPLFVKLITSKGREMYLPQIASAFLKLYDEEKGIVRGTLTSASEMDAQMAMEVQKALSEKTGKTFIIDEEVDPELIGGFTLKIGDDLFDGSVAGSLKRLKKSFEKAN
ncbi:MAG: ATP synthase F1 subunit delta [Bacteroidia bacterium]|nr:ATP synthase F1 subunit delta [Bacteroidia bacterium]